MYVDSVVFMYAFGAENPWREASVSFLRAAAARELAAVTSVETLQEIIHRYRSIRRFDELEAAYRGVLASVRSVFPVTKADVDEALELSQALVDVGVSARDLLHAAVARRHGISTVVTYDRDFETIPGIRAVTPAAVLGLR